MSTRRDIFIKLNKTKKLPTPSATTLKVIRLCQDEATSLNDITQVIQTDPALSAELLKYANAAFLSTGIQVASIQKATVKLGMRNVVNLALGFSLLSKNQKGQCKAFDYDTFWSKSIFRAIAAKTIAGLSQVFDPEEIFVCGLLSNIGQLALASLFPQEYTDIFNEFGFDSCADCGSINALEILADNPSSLLRKTLEQEQFEISSSELTTELFLDWGLPAPYALAAGFYDELDLIELGTGHTQKIADILKLSDQMSNLCHLAQPTSEQLYSFEKASREFGINEADFSGIFDSIIKQWHDWGEIFKIWTPPCRLYDEILAGDTYGS